MKSKLTFVFLFCCSAFMQLHAQSLLPDSALKKLSAAEFIEIVKAYHPVAKQANLLTERAQAELLIARGGWDPLIKSEYDRKTYDGANYYSYFENKITVPVWYGIEVNAGYDYVYGGNVNAENKLPKDGLGYLGISVPLLKNMLIDKQRATLRQAQIFRDASEQQRLIILNNLLYDALKTYYDWSYSYNELQIYNQAVQVADIRFKATVQSNLLGDRAAIDTTEALTQLQSRQYQLNEARLHFLQNSFELSNYLWLQNGEPRPLDTLLSPLPLTTDYTANQIQLSKADELVYQLRMSHPELMNYAFKLRQLDVERKLKIENLKPVLNVKYNLLSERFNFQSNTGIVFSNNYKFGFNFSMPLSFMQGRGALRLAKLEIKNTQLNADLKMQELTNKLRSYFNELITLQKQTQLYLQTLEGYRALFNGENTRFNNGESSLFLVNARENRYLDAQVKLFEIQAKYYKTEAALKWAVGNIGRE